VNHSHGAAASLIATLDLLRHDGFVLFSDYGSTELAVAGDRHQRFAGSRAMRLNFALLHHIFDQLSPTPPRIVTPEGDERAAIHTRLLCVETLPEVEDVFGAAFAQASFDALGELVQQARAARDRGAMDAAQALYSQAHQQYPENWYVLVEWAEFATYGFGDPALGVTLAEQAVFMNRISSPLAHNVYGEALYQTGRRAEAQAAYLEALRIQPDDIRAHGSLARAYADEGRYREAILEISLAIANDTAGAYRQNLVGKLHEILNQRDAARDGNQGQSTGRAERYPVQG
jgi:tetratricopeptide (TPR) repeat protein